MLLTILVCHNTSEKTACHTTKKDDYSDSYSEFVVELGVVFEEERWHEVVASEHAEKSEHGTNGCKSGNRISHDIGKSSLKLGQ